MENIVENMRYKPVAEHSLQKSKGQDGPIISKRPTRQDLELEWGEWGNLCPQAVWFFGLAARNLTNSKNRKYGIFFVFCYFSGQDTKRNQRTSQPGLEQPERIKNMEERLRNIEERLIKVKTKINYSIVLQIGIFLTALGIDFG